MVLGDGARDRGALADQISPLPYIGAGVGYVRLEASPDPVRVRAAYVTDDDIGAMAAWPSATCPAVAYEGHRLADRRAVPRVRDRAGPGRHRRSRCCGPNAACAATPGPSTPATWRTVTGDRPARTPRDAGGAAGDAAGPDRGQGPGRRARRLPAPGPAPPDQPRHRPRRAGPDPVRAHPGRGVPALRRTGQAAPRRAMPRRLAPGPRTRHRARPRPRRNSGPRSPTAPRCKPTGTPWPPKASTPPTSTQQIEELDQQITDAGIRGNVLPARPRRHRSTRRRQDAAHLPRRPVSARTVGKTYTAPDGTTFRPSLFVTLTCPSYGKVTSDGTPGQPGRLRLPAGGAGRAALRGAVRPVHPEPAPVHRL